MDESRQILRVRITGATALLVIAYSAWMMLSPPIWGEAQCAQSRLPSGTILGLEFAASSQDVANLIGEPGDDRRCLTRVQILRDNIWIIIYSALFVMVSFMFMRRLCPWAKYLARLGMVAGIAAAIFDWRENYYILEILSKSSADASSQLLSLRGATLSKWTLIFASMSILAVAFFGLSRLASWVGFLFALTAAVGLIGIWDHRALPVVQIPLVVSSLTLGVAALVRPRAFIESGC